MKRNYLKKKLRSRLNLKKRTKTTKKSSRNNKTVRSMMSRSTKNSKKEPKTKTMFKTHKKAIKTWTAMLLHSKIKASRIMNP